MAKMGLSPLPLAGRAMAAADWFDRWIGPLYRLLVRLWLAAALAGVLAGARDAASHCVGWRGNNRLLVLGRGGLVMAEGNETRSAFPWFESY